MNNIIDARRHLDNAKEILSSKAKKEDGIYTDKKYIKMAGHTAYTGILLAVDAIMPSKKGRKDVKDYQSHLAKLDKKALRIFNALYEHFHLSFGYDGTAYFVTAEQCFKEAETLISWVEKKL